MAPAHARDVVRVLAAVGISGLAAEVAFIGFSVLRRAEGDATSDLMLAETALVALVYGLLFAVALLARKGSAIVFAPQNYLESLWRKRMRARTVPIALGLFVLVGLMQVLFLVIGLSTPMITVTTLLHLYPIAGLMVASGMAVRDSPVVSCMPGTD